MKVLIFSSYKTLAIMGNRRRLLMIMVGYYINSNARREAYGKLYALTVSRRGACVELKIETAPGGENK